MLHGLFDTIPRTGTAEVEYRCGDGLNFCQIFRVPVTFNRNVDHVSFEDAKLRAERKIIESIDFTLFFGVKHLSTEGGRITRTMDGLLRLASSSNFHFRDLQIVELRPLRYINHSDPTEDFTARGEWIWEGGLWLPSEAA